LDFDGCEDVLVENCDIKGSDDNICFQCHKKERKMKNAVVVNCTLSSICDNVRIGMKSVGDIENITIKNCFFNNGYREGVKIESSEGGEISKINIFNIKMRNVRRPFYFIANNLICSLGIKKIPQIGKIKNVCIKDIEIVDDEEMAKTQFYMWGSEKCDMGYPIFGGIKIDAHKNYPLENITLQNINYINFGNVKKSEINNQYPPVYDKLNEQEKDKIGSSNYYPDWSVASHFFIRNVKNLTLENINLSLLNPDERDKIIIINCIGKY
ncbi:MAG: polygalacturonase, partial [Oscillospiraceae bacterium]